MTTRRPLVAGNWKMNGLNSSIADLQKIIAGAPGLPKVDLIVCPPATLIARFARSRARFARRDRGPGLPRHGLGRLYRGYFRGNAQGCRGRRGHRRSFRTPARSRRDRCRGARQGAAAKPAPACSPSFASARRVPNARPGVTLAVVGAQVDRALRTSILLSSFGAAPKVILVTSASPQEGKTTVSANSALVLAQRGSRVLLVDADLRRPGIGKLFGVPSDGRGLSSLISGVHKIEDVVVPTQVPNLWILPAGRIPPDPVELLGSHVMKGYITRWRKEFDHIIIDTPPCLSVTDAVVLSPEVDRVILVARSGKTTTPALRRACDLLLQVNARVMGIVLNAFGSGDSYHYAKDGRYSYYCEEASPQGETTTANKAS